MDEIKKRGRPKRTTPKSPEELEQDRLKAVEATRRWREKKKIQEQLHNVIQNGDVEDIVREIIDKPGDNFQELRPLAFKALKSVLKTGKDADKLKAANTVLDRTDPLKREVAISVEIHPVDLSAFRRLPAQSVQAIEGEFKVLDSPQNPPQSS